MYRRFGVKVERAHLDGISILVHGKYEKEEKEKEDTIVKEEAGESVAIIITQGYSRDHRPDLKQFTWQLLTSEAEGIPLSMNVGDGNKTD